MEELQRDAAAQAVLWVPTLFVTLGVITALGTLGAQFERRITSPIAFTAPFNDCCAACR